jgi:hypothetical protein
MGASPALRAGDRAIRSNSSQKGRFAVPAAPFLFRYFRFYPLRWRKTTSMSFFDFDFFANQKIHTLL